jgi:hypothetical protein
LCSVLADLFLFSYIKSRICSETVTGWTKQKKNFAKSFNHTYRYIDGVSSINKHDFHNYVHLIYPGELEIMDTTESDICASCQDILLDIYYIYDKHDDFNILICLWCTSISPSWFDTQELLMRMNILFKTRPITNKKVYAEGL